jgi:hypothetical protein
MKAVGVTALALTVNKKKGRFDSENACLFMLILSGQTLNDFNQGSCLRVVEGQGDLLGILRASDCFEGLGVLC